MLDTAFISYTVQQGLYTILEKTSYTHLPSLQEQAFVFLRMQRKIYFYIRRSILEIYDESSLT